jgi:hypothetical protein
MYYGSYSYRSYKLCRDICRKTQTWPFYSCIHFRIYQRPSPPVNSATFPSYRCLSEVDQPPFTWTSNGAEALWLTTCQVTGLLCLSRCSLRRRCTVHSSQGRGFAPHMTTAVECRLTGVVTGAEVNRAPGKVDVRLGHGQATSSKRCGRRVVTRGSLIAQCSDSEGARHPHPRTDEARRHHRRSPGTLMRGGLDVCSHRVRPSETTYDCVDRDVWIDPSVPISRADIFDDMTVARAGGKPTPEQGRRTHELFKRLKAAFATDKYPPANNAKPIVRCCRQRRWTYNYEQALSLGGDFGIKRRP